MKLFLIITLITTDFIIRMICSFLFYSGWMNIYVLTTDCTDRDCFKMIFFKKPTSLQDMNKLILNT